MLKSQDAAIPAMKSETPMHLPLGPLVEVKMSNNANASIIVKGLMRNVRRVVESREASG